MQVGFCGLGHMGSGMVRSLLRAGHAVFAFNRTRERAQPLEREGARIVSSPADCAQAEILFTMLADDPAVEEVVFGDRGITSAMPAGHVHVSCSTISVGLSERLAAEHTSRDQQYVAAPVFGRPEAADAGKLVVAAAGAHNAISRCRPALDAFSEAVHIVGNIPWQANLVKLCGNFCIASMLETLAEAFAALEKAGAKPSQFLDIVNGLFKSPVYANYGRAILEQRFSPAGFALKLGLKDIRLLLAASDNLTAPLPLASLLHDRLLTAHANGQADSDWSSVSRISLRDAGVGTHEDERKAA